MTKQERLLKINEIVENIYSIDVSRLASDVQKRLRDYFNDLSEQFAEYADENNDFDIKNTQIYIDDIQNRISKITIVDRETMRDSVAMIKAETKRLIPLFD